MVTVNVDFPALADLVSYLRENDAQQKQLGDLTAQVTELTKRLRKSHAGLETAVETAEAAS